jgi:CheY-like chemotaxis protein
MTKLDTICIIDDDNIYTMLLKKTISKFDVCDRVESFNNGKIAFESLKQRIEEGGATLPDVIFLDVNMPVLDGWMFVEEFYKIYNKSLKKVQIYVVSSSIAVEDRNKAKSNPNIQDYLVKPISGSTLQEIVATFHS